MPYTLRLATPDDAERVLAVYAPFVRDTTITFEYDVPDVDEMRRRMANVLAMYPWLLCEHDGAPAGYAYASKYHPRIAYQWCVETSIYLDPAHHGQGLGAAVYRVLLDLLRAQGLCVACASITLPNAPSVALHERLGFQPKLHHTAVGFKHGRWLDVGHWQCDLQPRPEAPVTPTPIARLNRVDQILHASNSGLRPSPSRHRRDFLKGE